MAAISEAEEPLRVPHTARARLPVAGRCFSLRDGWTALVRPIRPSDRGELQAGLRSMSVRSRHLRFATVPDRLSERELRYLTEVDQVDHIALIAFDVGGVSPRGVATARCVRVKGEPDVAEFALTVVDSHQCRGLGTLLLELLAVEARASGVRTLRGFVLVHNRRMIRIIQQLGGVERGRDASLLRFELPLDVPGGDASGRRP